MIMNTNTRKPFERLLAIALSFAMLFSLLPMTAFAESGASAIGVSGEIIAFEPLTEAVAKQVVPLGTTLNKLNLPESLIATVRVATATDAAVPETTEPVAQEPLKIEAPQITEKTIPIPVTWVSQQFDSEKAGAYIFTVNVEGFTVSVALPTISVSVGKSTGTVTAFAELLDEIRWQNTAQPVFPETVSGAVYGKPAEIPVTWQADHAYNAEHPEKGLYVFDAVLGDSYILAEDVETPHITVYIPETGISTFRMGGGGTATSPLEITTAHQLAEIAVLVNAGRLESFLLNGIGNVSLKLMNDLDLSAYGQSYNGGKGWVPIGFYNGASTIPFKGNFDGSGHTISGLYINDITRNFAGLFGTTKSATIKNLSLSAVNIRANNCVGSIVGMAYGTGSITICRVGGSVNGNSNLGGLIGTTSTMEPTDYSMSRCSFEGTVSGLGIGSYIGGLIGTVKNCKISDSYAAAVVSGNERVGGLVGEFNCLPTIGALQNCYAIGSVKGAKYIGGLVGFAQYGEIKNCTALNSDVEASTSDCGRVAGVNWNATLSGNEAFSVMGVKVSGSKKSTQDDAAGVDGIDITAADIKADGSIATRFTDADGWTIENGKLPGFGSAVDMPVHIMDGGYFTGAGTSESPYEISTPVQLAKLAELVNTGDTNYNSKHYKLTADIDLSAYGSSYNDGKGWKPIGNDTNSFMGKFDGNSKAITGLYINDDTLYAAGLFGEVKGSTIENLSVSGSVSGGFCVGVLAGALKNNSIVKNCHTTGSVNANTNGGGLAGTIFYINSISGGTISFCYSTATVTATQSGAGGILGGGAAGTIEYCAALNPSVAGPSKVGRIVGENDPSNGITLTGNYAFSSMVGGGSNKTADGTDGADTSADALQAVSGFPSALTTAPWTYQSGSLPGLSGKTVEMPAHITNKLTNFFAGGTGGQFTPYQIATAAQLAKLAELVNAGNVDYNSKYYKLTADINLSAYGKSFNGGKGWIPIGNNTSTTFKGSFDGNYKTISGLYINDDLYYTGLFGLADGPISNLGLTSVNITSTGTGGTGSIAGITQAGGTVSGCFVVGAISGGANVGGVVGTARCSIANCYATGSVKGTGSNIGGIAGECAALSNCYAANAVSGSDMVGGIAGMTGGELKNCAALNPSVAPNNSYVRRVVGSNTGAGTVKNNYAFSGMKGGGNNKTLNHFDGADFSIAQANTAAFWTTLPNWSTGSWNSMIWDFADGKLPTLSGFPAGLQSGDGGLYLTERDIANATVDASGPYTYTGSAIEPSLSVTFDGATLVKDADYTVTYSGNTNAGLATVTLSGIGNFTGAKAANFTIAPKALTTAVLTVLEGPFTYTGKQHKPNVTVTCDGKNADIG